jgi:hypothetical protein
LIENVFNSKIADPRKLQQKAKKEVSNEMLKESIQVTTSIEDCTRSIEKYFDGGLPEFMFIAQVQKKSNSSKFFARRYCHIL